MAINTILSLIVVRRMLPFQKTVSGCGFEDNVDLPFLNEVFSTFAKEWGITVHLRGVILPIKNDKTG